jgi:predicted nucleic acid-binding protein
VQLVIADTGPINYLLLIEQIDILPVLFERVILPVAVMLASKRGAKPSKGSGRGPTVDRQSTCVD